MVHKVNSNAKIKHHTLKNNLKEDWSHLLTFLNLGFIKQALKMLLVSACLFMVFPPFTSFFVFFFTDNLQKAIWVIILGSNPADFDLCALSLCRQLQEKIVLLHWKKPRLTALLFSDSSKWSSSTSKFENKIHNVLSTVTWPVMCLVLNIPLCQIFQMHSG